MTSTNSYELFLNTYLLELMELSDSELLDSVDAEAEKAIGLQLLTAAKVEAGRRRMARARAAIAQLETDENTAPPAVTADEARRFLRSAVNDPRFTLAARQLDELSDEDVLRVYSQIQQLQSASSKDSNGEK